MDDFSLISCLLKSPYRLLKPYLLCMTFVTMDLALTAVLCLQPGGAQQGYPGGPAPGQPMPNYPGAPATNPSMPGYGGGAPSNPQAPAISVRYICHHPRTSLKLCSSAHTANVQSFLCFYVYI